MAFSRFAKVSLALVVCLAIAAGCGSKKSSRTAAPAAAKTTTTIAAPTAALTGLPLADAAIRNRPILVVKVDNAPEARPQFGIDKADVIVEEKVEGDLSRFMAMFQSQDSDKVGPVRSLRSTDPKFLKPEGAMIAYSGGIPEFKALLAPDNVVDLGADNHGSTYYKRRSDRPFEHSLYTITSVLRTLTPKNMAQPKPLFQYLPVGASFSGAGIAPVNSVSLKMGGGSVAESFGWTWDANSKKFLRTTDGKPHMFEGVGQIAMKNVIIQFTPYGPTPFRDRAGSPVDEAETVGSGDAWVLVDGQIVKAHWSRPTVDDITTYTDLAGAPIKLEPGQTWLSLPPPGQFAQIQ